MFNTIPQLFEPWIPLPSKSGAIKTDDAPTSATMPLVVQLLTRRCEKIMLLGPLMELLLVTSIPW
ncbi:hypothetical protein D3C85_1442810 [compost metagenome]